MNIQHFCEKLDFQFSSVSVNIKEGPERLTESGSILFMTEGKGV